MARETPEGEIKKAIDKVLDRYVPHLWYRKTVRLTMGKNLLDYHGHVIGRAFAIEAKAPDKFPTKAQLNTTKEIEDAGGIVFHINTVPSRELKALGVWIENVIYERGWIEVETKRSNHGVTQVQRKVKK